MAQPWRTDEDMRQLTASWQFQKDQGQYDAPVAHHGSGANKADIAIAKALDAFNLQGGHGGGHEHATTTRTTTTTTTRTATTTRTPTTPPALDWGWSGRDTEHADERTDEQAHNWGAGRKWQKGDPIPAPILSSMPVRSRSRGRWDGDGM